MIRHDNEMRSSLEDKLTKYYEAAISKFVYKECGINMLSIFIITCLTPINKLVRNIGKTLSAEVVSIRPRHYSLDWQRNCNIKDLAEHF